MLEKDLQESFSTLRKALDGIIQAVAITVEKRDLATGGPSVMSLDQMEKELNGQLKIPSFPASAIRGEAIGATLKKCLELTLQSLQEDLNWGE